MPDLDVAALARSLEKTAASLKRHIADEAQRRATELGKTYAKAADERIRDNAADMQRLQDLVAELRRQLDVASRYAAAYSAMNKALQQAGIVARNRDDTVQVAVVLDCIEAGDRAGRDERDRQQRAKADAHA